MIKIYHYSNKDFRKYIKPDYFGENHYSYNSEQLSNIKRSYFYLNKNNIEIHLKGCKFCYIAEVDKKELYDIDLDYRNFKQTSLTADDFIRKVKNNDYEGIYNNNQVVLFYSTKIKNKKTLTKR